MKPFLKLLALLLSLACFASLIPAAYAQEAPEMALSIQESYVNPLYEGLLTEDDLLPVQMPRIMPASEDGYAVTPQEAAIQLREGMKQRNNTIVVYYKTDGYDGNPDTIRSILHEITEEAIRHTGEPTEGDYLMWQYGGWNANAEAAGSDDIYYWTFTFTYTYYTTAEQEAALTQKINEVLNSLNVSSQNDYRKICAVYDYICANIVYDHAHLEDPSYTRQFTAYAAMMDGTAVCQGYALLFYRMALSLDVDCRLISGLSHNQGHGWNIAALDGLYYNLDSTWDAGEEDFRYFLRSMSNFDDHARDPEYDTPEFHSAYPMSPIDYVPGGTDACSHNYLPTITDPGCLEGGYTTYQCGLCGHSYVADATAALGHNWDAGQITQDPTDIYPGSLMYTCLRCGATKTELLPATESVYRIFGDNRYETAFKAAEFLKELRGTDSFNTILVASGNDFADALSGSYLAVRRDAPILLVNRHFVERTAQYIRDNLAENGTVYLLGGTAAVPEEMEAALEGVHVVRLAGANRYETNLAILNEAGMDGSEILVCTGLDFADSLSASASGKPILLVRNRLLDNQKAFLEAHSGSDYYIIGGENAVTAQVAQEIAPFGQVQRITGSNRYETSVSIASLFAPEARQMVIVYGRNFPDGLCGGILASQLNAPLILTQDRSLTWAKDFAVQRDIRSGIVLGGTALISDEMTRSIFSMEETQDILLK